MGSPSPPHWTFAARAAYFGDRMCAFCHHRNPHDARFCNDCASPLHLKPCTACDAVNDDTATRCHQCGAAYPASANAEDGLSTPADAADTPGAPLPDTMARVQPPVAAPPRRAAARWLAPGRLLVAAVATIGIVGAYQAYRLGAASTDATGLATQASDAFDSDASAATLAMPAAVEQKPAEPEAMVEEHALATRVENSDRPKRAAMAHAPVTATAPKRAALHHGAKPERRAVAGTTVTAVRNLSEHADADGARRGAGAPSDRWHVMHTNLAQCDGDLLARVVCDQRVRRHFCEGHWGKAPECASGVANEHGQ